MVSEQAEVLEMDEQSTVSILKEIDELNDEEGTESPDGLAPPSDIPVALTKEETTAPAADDAPAAPAIPPQVSPTSPFDQTQQVRQLQEQNARLVEQQQQGQVEAETERYRQELIGTGVPEDSAKYLADQQRQSYQTILQIQQQSQNSLLEQQGKMNAAMHYGQLHGVSPQNLMMYDSPQAMEMAAKQQQQINDLQKQVGESKKAAVPAQIMDNNQSSANGNMSEDRLLDSALSKAPMDRTEFEQAVMKRAAGL